jgi:hypothetical protein
MSAAEPNEKNHRYRVLLRALSRPWMILFISKVVVPYILLGRLVCSWKNGKNATVTFLSPQEMFGRTTGRGSRAS